MERRRSHDQAAFGTNGGPGDQLGTVDTGLVDERARWLSFAQAEFDGLTARYDQTKAQMEAELAVLSEQIVVARSAVDLQEIGLLFDGEHPTAKSADLASAVDDARRRRKALAKSSAAVVAGMSLTFQDSAAKGRKITQDLVKLMLRAYNGEVDALVKSTTATNAERKVDALNKKRQQIERLGQMIQLSISGAYHDLCCFEIQATSRWRALQLVEKELERERKERLREEKKARAELEAEQARCAKELAHRRAALAAMEERTDVDPAELARLRQEVAAAEEEIASVARRAANVRAGYVYVISNPGSMGPGIVKIGMTRRLDPMDRVRELGDASVPFRFSVHALIFSDDAVTLEGNLHRRFSQHRINRVNLRREFFRVEPAEVRQALVELNAHLVEWDETPTDDEWDASR